MTEAAGLMPRLHVRQTRPAWIRESENSAVDQQADFPKATDFRRGLLWSSSVFRFASCPHVFCLRERGRGDGQCDMITRGRAGKPRAVDMRPLPAANRRSAE
jgi:hypothetical protein